MSISNDEQEHLRAKVQVWLELGNLLDETTKAVKFVNKLLALLLEEHDERKKSIGQSDRATGGRHNH